jgi:hypothetical protein
MLVKGATSVFSEMQDSINMIWNLQVKAEQGGYKCCETACRLFPL